MKVSGYLVVAVLALPCGQHARAIPFGLGDIVINDHGLIYHYDPGGDLLRVLDSQAGDGTGRINGVVFDRYGHLYASSGTDVAQFNRHGELVDGTYLGLSADRINSLGVDKQNDLHVSVGNSIGRYDQDGELLDEITPLSGEIGWFDISPDQGLAFTRYSPHKPVYGFGRTFEAFRAARDVRWLPDGDKLLVATGELSPGPVGLYELHDGGAQLVRTFDVAAKAIGFGLNDATFWSSSVSGLQEIDLATGAVIQTLNIPIVSEFAIYGGGSYGGPRIAVHEPESLILLGAGLFAIGLLIREKAPR